MKKNLFNAKKVSNVLAVALVFTATVITYGGSFLLFGEPKAPKSLIR